ncbi:hypothetical protein [Thalassotalea atypica]|uniref:hypothetical protein n=1 Tax=Thalassotalea atypica TaxID=2054316 RepID=UPI0025727368|nr:hypothetical protein [Thalassotalea atypica]
MNNPIPGSYQIERQNNLLVVDARGPFDEEIAIRYQQDIENVTSELNGQPWGILNTYYGNAVFTPEIEKRIIETTKYRITQGLVATAAVFLESAHADVQQMQLRRIYQQYRIPFHVFSDISNAKIWLEQYLTQEKLCS